MSSGNDSISSQQYLVLSRCLQECEERIRKLEEELQKEHGIQQILDAKVKALEYQSQPNKHASIHQIPHEILIQIFQFVIAQKATDISRLLFACKEWYQIIINTPSLWSRIYFRPNWDIHDIKRLGGYLKYALTCSQQHPLDIHVLLFGADRLSDTLGETMAQVVCDFPKDVSQVARSFRTSVWGIGSDAEWYKQKVRSYLALLLRLASSSSRWRSFTLEASHSSGFLPQKFLDYLRKNFILPILEACQICVPSLVDVDRTKTRKLILPEMPALKTLIIQLEYPLQVSWIGNVVPKLDHLCGSLKNVIIPENIRTLYFRVIEPGQDVLARPKGKISLPRLEQLSLDGSPWKGFDSFLHQLDAPLLETVRLLGNAVDPRNAVIYDCLGAVTELHLISPPFIVDPADRATDSTSSSDIQLQ